MLTRKEMKKNARKQLKGNWTIVFGIMFVYGAIASLCGLIPPVIWGYEVAGSLYEWTLGDLILMFASPALGFGLMMIFLNLTKSVQPKIMDLFEGFKFYGKVLWLSIIVGFFTFLWSLLLVVPGIIKALSYSQSYFVLAENPDLTAREALSRSKEIMQGKKMDLFVMGLSFIGVCLIPFAIMMIGTMVITLGLTFDLLTGVVSVANPIFVMIGDAIMLLAIVFMYLYIFPYVGVAIANFYRQLTGGTTEVVLVDKESAVETVEAVEVEQELEEESAPEQETEEEK